MSDPATTLLVQRAYRKGLATGLVGGLAIAGALVGLLVGLGVLQYGGPLGDGSDPIVVDNSQLRIHRKKHCPSELVDANGNPEKNWSLGEMKTFTRLSGTVKYKGGNNKHDFSFPLPPRGGNEEDRRALEFYAGGKYLFTVGRAGGLSLDAVATPVDSAFEFERVAERDEKVENDRKTHAKLKRKGGSNRDPHIDEIRFDGWYLCFGQGVKPTFSQEKCAASTSAPEDLRLYITTN